MSVLVLALAGSGTLSAQMAENSRAAGLEQCVEETGYMRKNLKPVRFGLGNTSREIASSSKFNKD